MHALMDGSVTPIKGPDQYPLVVLILAANIYDSQL